MNVGPRLNKQTKMEIRMVPKEVSWAITENILFLFLSTVKDWRVMYSINRLNMPLFFFFKLSCSDAFELWCWRRLESPLDCKKIKPVNSKGNQSWIFIGRTDAEAEAPILWSPDGKSRLIGKDPDAGKDWGQKVKGVTEDEMAGWHHWLNGHEFEQTPGDSDGQGSLLCYSPQGLKELDRTYWLNNCNSPGGYLQNNLNILLCVSVDG